MKKLLSITTLAIVLLILPSCSINTFEISNNDTLTKSNTIVATPPTTAITSAPLPITATVAPAAPPTTEPNLSSDANLSTNNAYNAMSFSSLSPDKKTIIEVEQIDADNQKLKLIDYETNCVLMTYNYPSDTKFTALWSEDSYYVAVGFKNKIESRIVIYISKKGIPSTGKEVFFYELSQFAKSINLQDADAHMVPLEFEDDHTLVLSIDWVDVNGKRIAGTTKWDFKHATFTQLESQSS